MIRLFHLSTVVLLTVPALLIATNPTEQDYDQHLVSFLQTTTCRQPRQPFNIRSICAAITVLPRDSAAELIGKYSHQENFLLFSLYTANVLGLEDSSVGVAKVFVRQSALSPFKSELTSQTAGKNHE